MFGLRLLKPSVPVQRGIVHGRISDMTTEYSSDELPSDESFAESLLEWRSMAPKVEGDWIFVNLTTGKPYHSSTIQQDFLRPAGKIDFKDELGWHTFRRSYRSILDAAGAPIGVQQQLMRHGQVSTTMNTTKCLYGGEAGCQWEGSPNGIRREKGNGYCAANS